MKSRFKLFAFCIFTAACFSLPWAAVADNMKSAGPAPFKPPVVNNSPETTGPLEALTPKSNLIAKHRSKLLKDLYEQLEASGDEQNAKRLETAIEKIWFESGSDTVDLLMKRAISAIQNKDLNVALDVLNFVTKLAPDYPEGWNKRAMVHYLRENYAQSMLDLRQVLSQDPRHYKAIHGLSLLFREYGKKKAALKALRKALQLHPFLTNAREAERELAREIEGQGI